MKACSHLVGNDLHANVLGCGEVREYQAARRLVRLARLPAPLSQKRTQPGSDLREPFPRPHLPDLEQQLLAIQGHRLHNRVEIVDGQLAQDIGEHVTRRRPREGHEARFATLIPAPVPNDSADIQVGRTEVVSPLTHAMGFIDHAIRDRKGGGKAADALAKCRHLQPLGSNEDEQVVSALDGAIAVFPSGRLGQRGRLLSTHDGDRAVNAEGLQVLFLVDHQRAQRIDDQREPRLQKRGQLEAERFTGTGRQESDNRPECEGPFDDFDLSLAKLHFAKDIVEYVVQGGSDGRSSVLAFRVDRVGRCQSQRLDIPLPHRAGSKHNFPLLDRLPGSRSRSAKEL